MYAVSEFTDEVGKVAAHQRFVVYDQIAARPTRFTHEPATAYPDPQFLDAADLISPATIAATPAE
jgi:hypothetical protein